MKIINKPLASLCVFGALIACVIVILWLITNNDANRIPQFIKQNVILATGVNFDTGKLFALDPTTGLEVLAIPCDPIGNLSIPESDSEKLKIQNSYLSKNDKIQKGRNCSVLIETTGDPLKDKLINDAINISQSIIDGKVNFNGKSKPARFIVSLTTIFESSHCASTYSAGAQRTNCINKEAQCAAIRAATGNPNHPC